MDFITKTNKYAGLPFHEAVEPHFPKVIVCSSDLVPGLGDVVQFGDSLQVNLEWKILIWNP